MYVRHRLDTSMNMLNVHAQHTTPQAATKSVAATTLKDRGAHSRRVYDYILLHATVISFPANVHA